MGLFGKSQPELPENWLDDEPAQEAGVDHNSVLDYLLQLKSDDYQKLLKLADIFRNANKEAGELIPQYDPDHVEAKQPADEDAQLDKLVDDELEAAFIEDNSNAPKKVKVKSVGRN